MENGNGKCYINRRTALKTAGAAGMAATGILLANEAASAQQQPDAGQIIRGKHRRLHVFTANPAVMETPLDLLQAHDVTPAEILFLRNNQQPKNAATMKPAPLRGWRIELTGLINRRITIHAEQLLKLPQTEVTMVLQCAGNGRSLYAQSKQTRGTQWGRGAIGNVRFGGVALAELLRRHKVEMRDGVRFVAAEGHDGPAPKKDDFEHSIPVRDMLEKAIIAVRMNREMIPAIHGGPVRLVVPGFYATMHLKWLTRLRFERTETTNHNHIPRYRTPNQIIRPGGRIEYTLDNSTPTWNMKVATIVFSPRPGAKLQAGRTLVRGVAFNDGTARLDAVHVSRDRGRSWQRAQLTSPKSPYAWYQWSFETKLERGTHEIWVRAIDRLGRSQPIDGSISWNPSGYEWNGVEKIRVRVA